MRLAPPASSSAVMLEPIMAIRAITFFTANPPYQRELPPAPLLADEVTLRFEALQPPKIAEALPAQSLPSLTPSVGIDISLAFHFFNTGHTSPIAMEPIRNPLMKDRPLSARGGSLSRRLILGILASAGRLVPVPRWGS